ncbi:hypothetical protein FE374_13685 [Georgenia yuyongxinii]|uniref:SAF domain-containing protein n=1 Tax=Georgenia yuyongxinii TaxID=2589797 RepID=A0A5B8C4L1_9MICO|nr:SAF domain-containing protein [Georgenia yuyongxinii]QDC25524.1 hypothetical protein FE374_13685 [Georgenia yuyongxinii]
MSLDDAPQARRLRRPTWRDPRLGVGVLLVAGSVALGTWAVQDAAATTAVYAARQDLTPGDALDADAVVVTEVRLGAPGEHYLRVADGLPDGAVTIRTVAAGELVPVSAVGASDAVDLRPVVVPLGLSVPAGLGPGAVVDLWLTPAPVTGGLAAEEPAKPELLAADLVVAEVLEDDSMFSGGTGVSVELLVPRLDLPDVLGALSSDGQLVAVPTFGGRPPAGTPDDGGPAAAEEQ